MNNALFYGAEKQKDIYPKMNKLNVNLFNLYSFCSKNIHEEKLLRAISVN